MKIHYVLPLCIEQFVPDLRNDSRENWHNFRTRRQGFENFIARVTRDNGHEVYLWCMTNLIKKETRLRHRDGYTVVLIPRSFRSFNLMYPIEPSLPLFIGLWREFRKGNIDAMHLHEYYTAMSFPVSLLCRAYNRPFISHYHGGHVMGRGIAKLPLGFMIMLAVWLSSRILVINKEEIKKLTRVFRFPEQRIELCPYGIDTDVFCCRPQDEARNALDLLSRKKYVLFVGRLSDFHKGVSYLLKAFAKIATKNHDTELIIVGGGPDELRLKKLAEDLGIAKHVLFVGPITDQKTLAAYYNSADVVVVPSLFEAFGIVTIEAMSCGKPVVGSKVGGIKEIITHGKTGYLISSGNISELEEKISELLNHPETCKELGNAARKEVEQKYSYRSLGARLERIYRTSVSRR